MIYILPTELKNGKLSILCESYDIEEVSGTAKTGEVETTPHKVYLVGKALTFGQPTRNKVSYTKNSGEATLHTWAGKPFLNCHKDDDVLISFGHVESVSIRPDNKGRESLWYKVDIDPEEKEFIHKAKRKDIPGVSVQVLVSDIRRKESIEFGDYIEADIKEGLELSGVLIPGERETFGYITEEKFVKMAESYIGDVERVARTLLKKEQYPDTVMDVKKKEKPLEKKGDVIYPNAAGVPVQPEAREDITTATGDGLIQPKGLARKIKKAPENKIIPDLIPRRMISMQSLDKDHEKKTNVADETQEQQEVGFTFDGKTLKYWKKGGNNIPGVPLKGYKAERLSTVVSCCNRPMFVMEKAPSGIALFCNKCGRTMVKNEKYWSSAYNYFKEKLELKKQRRK